MPHKSPVATIAILRTLTKHREGDTILVEGTGDIYVFDFESAAVDDGSQFVRPTNFNSDGVWIKRTEGSQDALEFVDVVVTSAEVLALNATPKELVAAPGAGKALVFEGAVIFKAGGVAYAGVAAGEDLGIKYTDGSGLEVAACEMTGFADDVGAQVRYIRPTTKDVAAGAVSDIVPVDNAALVAHMLVGEIITGDSDFKFRMYYRVIPTVL